jgi:hypothetical protein
MSRLLVTQYQAEVEKIIQYGGSRKETRTYALYKLTIMCMNDIWSFQALRMKSR